MNDISILGRRKIIGKRIAKERKENVHLTQDELADKIGEITGVRPKQSTVSMWERGESFPDNIETIFAMSKIFGCDCGYLLCDYDEKTHDAKGICQATGLSESTINALCSMATWGVGQEAAAVIDALIFDFGYATKGEVIAPLIYLINWYLKYDGSQSQEKRVQFTGEITDTSDTTGYLGNSLNLDSRIIENAALIEIQQGLISLKKRNARKKGKNNGQHQTE